ncbi:MAG TPA: VIT1/CCC1 transporter family protein [Candidatus Absconditabacterales bacterium]|nr:VIT1/CCC1 transporter family protein [Candidatus Absconditabacterales bacterium]
MSQSIHHHLSQEHKISPRSQYIGEVVYGGIDGIITTFAVVAGFVGAGAVQTLGQIGPFAVVLFGLANLFGDGVSMALGKYLSTKSEQDIYRRAWSKELYEIQHHHDMEYQESIDILIQQGMSPTDAQQYIQIISQYPTLWTKWMMDNELQLPDSLNEKPLIQSIITLFSFIIFGAIPLIPFLFMKDSSFDFWHLSLIMTAIALLLLGFVRWSVTKMNIIRTVGQILLLGAIAATVAYWTGELVTRWGG